MGCVLPIQRRIKLIEIARRADSYIIEDDYDREMRLRGPHISPLQLLDPERVIHFGTFTASVCPSMRLGYVVMPAGLRSLYPEWVENGGWVVSPFLQWAMARFISQGYLDLHVRRQRKALMRKAQLLFDTLRKSFKNRIAMHGDAVGSYFMVEFKDTAFTPALMRKIREQKVDFDLVENHAIIKGKHRNMAVFGCGGLTERQILSGIERIRNVIDGT